MAGHDELREQAGLYVLGALTPAEQAAFEAHLATCGECAAEVRTLSSVAGALVHAVPQSEPSPALRARVLAAVGASPSTAAQRTIAPEAAIARDTASAADTTIARDARVAPDARFGPEASIVRTNTLAPWLAAAASLALAVALGAYAAMLRTRVGDLEVRLRQATLRAVAEPGRERPRDRGVRDAARSPQPARHGRHDRARRRGASAHGRQIPRRPRDLFVVSSRSPRLTSTGALHP